MKNGDRVRLSIDGSLATLGPRERAGTVTGSGFNGFYIGKVAVRWDGRKFAEIVPADWLEPLLPTTEAAE